MDLPEWIPAAAGTAPRRLYVYNGGFLTQRRIRRILELSGYDISLGKPSEGDLVGVWGQSPTSPRGEAVANYTNSEVIRVEDAFLRSVKPGRDGEPPLGLLIDDRGVHFDASKKSRLEELLIEHPLDDTALLTRAKDGIKRLRAAHLSKYNAFDPDTAVPEPGYVLVIDQTAGDASVKASRADRNRFLEMLFVAREENPHARIIVKTHPETAAGHREGHYQDGDGQFEFLSDPVSPWHLLEGATTVYTVSSQMGFDAILAGHRPVVFGQPFYAGWGLTDDRMPVDRRQRKLTRAQLFAAAMILAPVWYDPFQDKLCSFERAVSILEAEVRAWREDHRGWSAQGMRLWKRSSMQKAFGRYKPLVFGKAAPDRRHMVWGLKAEPEGAVRVEDGFLRSRGLGAELVPPMSLAMDTRGIYYDPSQPSDLEHLISTASLTQTEHRRAEDLIRNLTTGGLSKYNLDGAALPDLPEGRRILVPGQVEDDASIQLGAGDIRTNADLLAVTRAANPDAVILYKPHPDVEAGLRIGAVDDPMKWADAVLSGVNANAALEAADEVWTMTSTIGFEALLRGKQVTCLGQPFYAGWGLTNDATPHPRRTAKPDIETLAHCCLIAYPRYFDPVTGQPCPVEVIVERLTSGDLGPQKNGLRALAKLQGVFASFAYLWR